MNTLEELDPLYHFNTHYPDRLSVLDATYSTKSALDNSPKSKISRRKNNPRYKTQPITFDEIKEVEEPVTPNDENRNNTTVNSFLTKLQECGGLADNRLQPQQKFESVKSELIACDSVGSGGYASNIWYDSPYPTKLSFLDVPETMSSHHHASKDRAQSEKSKLKGRAARRRNNPRYKTQPITFDEIKEVEEPDENSDQATVGNAVNAGTPTNSIDVLISSTKSSTDQAQTLLQCGYAR